MLDQIVLERRESKSGALLNRYSLLIFLLTGSIVLCLIFQKIEPEHSSVQPQEQVRVLVREVLPDYHDGPLTLPPSSIPTTLSSHHAGVPRSVGVGGWGQSLQAFQKQRWFDIWKIIIIFTTYYLLYARC